ncbi:MAG: ABC transporter permease [Bryobacteraceae bacterium]|jgi:ABC-type multidrug transport system permease subunit
MRFVWISALKDLRRLRRDPFALVTWIGIPAAILAILYLVFGRGTSSPQGRLLVADEDQTFLSRTLVSAFGQEPLGKMLVVERVTLEEGRQRIDRGDGSAFLQIPKGFAEAFFQNRPFQLKLVTNPSQRILPGIIEETLSIVLEAGSYLQALFADPLQKMAQGPGPGAPAFSDQAITDIAVRTNRLIGGLGTYLNPPLIKLETKVIEEKQTAIQSNFAMAFFPGMLVLAVFFVAQGLAADVWKERSQGALRRLATTPRPLETLLAGKLVAAMAVLLALGVVGLLTARWLVKMPVHFFPLAALWIALSGAGLFLLLVILQVYASSERAGNVLGNLVMFPLIIVGGSFMPIEFMPESLAAVGRLTPNGWALAQLRAIMAGSVEPLRLAAAFAGLVLLSALAFLVAARRLRRAFLF